MNVALAMLGLNWIKKYFTFLVNGAELLNFLATPRISALSWTGRVKQN